MRKFVPLMTSLLVVCQTPVFAEAPKIDPSRLTLERIYSSSEFDAKSYAARWLPDGAGYLTVASSKEAPGRNIVRLCPETGEERIVIPASQLIPAGETAPLSIDSYSLSADQSLALIYTNSKRVWRRNTRGDYWVLDRSSGELRQLGGDVPPSTLMFAKLSPTSRYVAYVRDRNIYIEDLRSHSIRCLTSTENDDIINGTFDWVYEEELGLRDGFRWSEDGKYLAYWRMDTQGVRRFPLVSTANGLYPRITPIPYPKTGQQNPSYALGVCDLEGNTRWMEIPGDPREHYLARMQWIEGSKKLLVQQLNRLQNTNRVMLVDADTGQATTVLTERDEAWVDIHDELFWLDGGQKFTWVSERDGWRHLYVASLQGGPPQRITPGEFDVIRLLHIDEREKWVYYLASPEDATQQYLYRGGLDGRGHERLTPDDQPGIHAYQFSPNSEWALHTRSMLDSPPVTDLIRVPSHESVRVLEDNRALRQNVGKLSRSPREFFRVEISEGVSLDAWCIKPPDLDPQQKYPLLVHVYGEPAGQTVLDRWGGKNYLWHLMLAQQGYVVISIDNRGTPAPRGRQWRKCVYRQVGVLAPRDQAAAVRHVLEDRPYLDPKRIGVWGWSGGGSMTLNALFKYPDLYKTGISIAPVPNQRYYDTIYQERYMGLPQDNVEGYRDGSAIHFARQLQGNLLLIHGTGDDNCHYQTTELLINELIRHNKRFSMMAYPNRSHSIREGTNTTRHLRELMTAYLYENLPAGAAGAGE